MGGPSIRVLVHPLGWWKGGFGPRLGLLVGRQWLAVGAVEGHARSGAAWSALRISQMRVGGVCGDECLGLRRDGGEHALLIEPNTVATAAVLRSIKS